jgi:hypothetical protein
MIFICTLIFNIFTILYLLLINISLCCKIFIIYLLLVFDFEKIGKLDFENFRDFMHFFDSFLRFKQINS